ncbi:MAG: TM0996/MTH895 family glutaredoxin-like protein [Bacteroidales bacterium]|nr:TM0996/MTH895 family glutaredoxin-like protein [Bacteroidales bacterium]
MEIKVLGPGCSNCVRLENLCKEVVEELGLEARVEKITDINEYGNYGVMLTPGLVVNGKVLLQGKLPTKATLGNWLMNLG